MCYV
jgi:hypothetical protein